MTTGGGEDETANGLRHSGAALRNLQPERLGVRLAGRRIEFVDWGFYAPEPWRNFPHVHSCYELCYTYAGHGTFRVAGTEHPIGPGDLFLARPGDVHDITAAADDPMGIVFWSWAVLHDTPGAGRTGTAGQPPATSAAPARSAEADHDAAELMAAFTTADNRIATAADGPLPRILLLLAHEAAEPGPGSTEMIISLASALVLASARALSDPPTRHPTRQPPTTPGGPTLTTMIRYLHDNYHRPIRIQEVAAQVHLSERHAARLFRKFAGCTMHTYLTRYRLEAAAQLLSDPTHRNTPIAAIARSCGYSDSRHFSESFQRHWGLSPAALRTRGGTTHL
ncbi:AraC family transcriptional regulator [Catenulispora pinisilvae]|uniref:AraC family transcriptional regulator n=1 Tax=Catenulispora pinisilvae TaxID=2705253 RepID=UPI0018922A18|nr:AraC family transcriptional regulator [Catenulispora pinisilvae]